MYTLPERIMCAANHYVDEKPAANCAPSNITSGLIVCGMSHCQAIYIYHALTGKSSSNMHQGFMTSHNRFVYREEAMTIARAAGQIVRNIPADSPSLFSEDLYSD